MTTPASMSIRIASFRMRLDALRNRMNARDILKACGVLALLCFISSYVYKYCMFMSFHAVVFNHYPGPCRLVENIVNGSEDIEIIPGTNYALITSGLRLWERNNKHYWGRTSQIFGFDFDDREPVAHPLKIRGFDELDDSDFHGLSVHVDDKKGAILVYVVNHGRTDHRGGSLVEMFAFNQKEETLNHLETLGKDDPNFGSINDVLAVGHRQFYVTNTLFSSSKAEMLLQLKWAPITYFDNGQSFVAAKKRLLLGNGIAQSPDGRHVYVAHSWEREVIVYSRQPDNSLQLEQRVSLYTSPDNIYVDSGTGDLYVGCQPVVAQTFASIQNAQSTTAPSKILRLRTDAGLVTGMSDVFSDDGNLISASTTGVYRKNRLLVGTVCSKALVCDVKYLP